jgi:3-keto-disaccharide hydrolase
MSTARVGRPLLLALVVGLTAACGGTDDALDAAKAAVEDAEETASVQESQRPEDTEVWEPEPALVEPGSAGAPPSDAVVLFDGTGLSAWEREDGTDAEWLVADGAMTVVGGARNIRTRQGFGDVQLHIEWRSPAEVSGESQGRGNSGVFFMERYELQVLDSYENRTYSNGQAGSIYKQHIPLVNASRGPGEWQSYDVAFTAPRFAANGELSSPARMTVFHNGVLIQNQVELAGPTEYIGQPQYEAHEDRVPILLQDHGNPVSYRNVWVRELPGG